MKKLIVYVIALTAISSTSLFSMNNEQRIVTLEKQVNAIIKNEKERTEAINRLASSVLELEKKLKPGKMSMQMETSEE